MIFIACERYHHYYLSYAVIYLDKGSVTSCRVISPNRGVRFLVTTISDSIPPSYLISCRGYVLRTPLNGVQTQAVPIVGLERFFSTQMNPLCAASVPPLGSVSHGWPSVQHKQYFRPFFNLDYFTYFLFQWACVVPLQHRRNNLVMHALYPL